MGNYGSTPTSPEIEQAHEQHDECGTCEEECKSEPYNPNLVGTVGYYERAVVVCSGTNDWPAKIEKTKGNFVHTLFSAIKSRNDVRDMPKVTACNERSSGEGYDIYVYPDSVKYLGIKEDDIPVFIEDQIVKGEISNRLKHVSVSGKYHVLVCTHASRDKRCGRNGTQALTALQELVTSKGVADRVVVDGCSHIGGHKYAGVAVVYPPGDFYGYLNGRNVEIVLNSYLDPKKPKANQFWRGRMGTDEEQQAKEAGFTEPKKKKDKGERRDKGEKGEKRRPPESETPASENNNQ